jgi:hypothetical protein
MPATTPPRRFVTGTLSRTHRLTADIVLDYTNGATGPTAWHITLTDRATDQTAGTLAFPGPYTRGRETAFVEWLRAQQRALGLPDDGDLFAMQVRHDIYELLGMCYVEQPDIRP